MRVLAPGPLSMFQDGGRFGFMASGFSPAGALDRRAAALAHLLVGNHEDDAVLEMTFLGARLCFDTNVCVALTGGEFAVELNGEALPDAWYRAFAVNQNDVLSIGAAKSGCRSYLAVLGGFGLEPVMGSFSTNLKCGIGGWGGRRLKAGDSIPLRWPEAQAAQLAERRLAPPLPPPQNVAVRVVLGPQDDCFTKAGVHTFLSARYHVTADADRMGLKLDGPGIAAKTGYDIISDGIVQGSVQVPASGKPIVMLADCQTTGGYAKIATVVTPDLPLLAQLRPGGAVAFAAVTLEESRGIYKKWQRELGRVRYQMMWLR
jgi:biotin-dependent carboxylase-like uncharacterized protein